MLDTTFYLCKVCNGPYSNPMMLDCGHSFCLKCLKTKTDTSIRPHSKPKTKRKKDLNCPLCGMVFKLEIGSLDTLKVNEFLSKIVKHLESYGDGHEMVQKYTYSSADFESFIFLRLEEIKQKLEIVFEILDKINTNFINLKKTSKICERKIRVTAREYKDSKNSSNLMRQIERIVEEEEERLAILETKFEVTRLGLQYYQEKMSLLQVQKQPDDVVEETLSMCQCFLDSCIFFKNTPEGEARIEFIKFPKGVSELGILYLANKKMSSEVNISKNALSDPGNPKVACSLKFEKKLSSVAYHDETGEFFLVFACSKDVLVLQECHMAPDSVAPSRHPHRDIGKMAEERAGDTRPRVLSVVELEDANDAVICLGFLFVSERSRNWLHRVPLMQEKNHVAGISSSSSSVRKWDTGSYNNGLSVTSRGTLLVACNSTSRLIEYTTDGVKVKVIALPATFTNPRHALALPEEFYLYYPGFSESSLVASARGHSGNICDSESDDEELDDKPSFYAVCVCGSKQEVLIINSKGEVSRRFPTGLINVGDKSDKLNYPVHLALSWGDLSANGERESPAFVVCDRLNSRLLVIDQYLTLMKKLTPITVFNDAPSLVRMACGKQYEVSYSRHSNSESQPMQYKMKYPAKVLLTQKNVMYAVDKDYFSLVKFVFEEI